MEIDPFIWYRGYYMTGCCSVPNNRILNESPGFMGIVFIYTD